MKAKNITIKNTTTNDVLVGTQLEWNIWLNPGYTLESPEMILLEMKNQFPESEFEILDMKVTTLLSLIKE